MGYTVGKVSPPLKIQNINLSHFAPITRHRQLQERGSRSLGNGLTASKRCCAGGSATISQIAGLSPLPPRFPCTLPEQWPVASAVSLVFLLQAFAREAVKAEFDQKYLTCVKEEPTKGKSVLLCPFLIQINKFGKLFRCSTSLYKSIREGVRRKKTRKSLWPNPSPPFFFVEIPS